MCKLGGRELGWKIEASFIKFYEMFSLLKANF